MVFVVLQTTHIPFGVPLRSVSLFRVCSWHIPSNSICATCFLERRMVPENCRILTDPGPLFTTKVIMTLGSVNKGKTSWYRVSFQDQGCLIELSGMRGMFFTVATSHVAMRAWEVTGVSK
jgi:hypothetical protein